MKKILLVSDTHGYDENLYQVLEKEKPINMLIHCGDSEGSMQRISWKANCSCCFVRGNNDYDYQMPYDVNLSIEGYKVLVTHGHRQHISYGLDRLGLHAQLEGKQIVMFGHTHRPMIDRVSGILFLNPGSLTYPRQENRKPSYIVLTISDKGDINSEIKFLEKN